jgi:hypothetical protein
LELKMARKTVPTEKRLILSLAAHNGSATLSEIRLNFYGRLNSADLNAALEKLTGLVAVEKSRSKGNRRPTTRLSLTLHGWAAVQFLRPGWKPQRLATDILKAWLSELQAERDPWAMSLLVDAEDARQWRQHEDERKARDRAKEKKRAACEKPEPRYPSAGRNRSEEELEARREWAASKGFTPKDAQDEFTDDQAPEIRGRSVEAQSPIGGDAQVRFAAFDAQRRASGIDPVTGTAIGSASRRNLPPDYEEVKRGNQAARDAELIKTCILCPLFTVPGELRSEHYHAATGKPCPGSNTRV